MTNLEPERRAELALALQEKAKFTWKDLTLGRKHQHGLEHLPAFKIKRTVPERFSDEKKFTVFRYSADNRPMVGVRVADTFHVLWIERDFGDVYDH